MTGFLTLLRGIESRLFARGFTAPLIRRLLAAQILCTGALLAAGLALAPVNMWPLGLAVGSGLATCSLWQIARFVQGGMYQEFSAALGIRLFLGFTARLVLSGCIVAILIVRFGVPVAPLLLGLGSTVFGITLWALSRSFRKPVKET